MQKLNFGEKFDKPFVIALGFFDCMHKGHMSLINRAKELACENQCSTAIFTFNNNHLKVLGKPDKLIYTFDERCEIFESVGIDVVVSSNFDRQFMSMSGDCFLKELFKYDIKAIVCGFDYTCGNDRKDSKYVQKTAHLWNTICDIVPQISQNGVKISSTLVRELLLDKKIAEVNSLLNQPYFIEGTVENGRKVGRKLGFPTANLIVDEEKLLLCGVYSCRCKIDNVEYSGILNIGNKPTFDVSETGVEVHLKDFSGDLYGKKLKIQVDKFLRNIKKFDSSEKLVEQLKQDIANI